MTTKHELTALQNSIEYYDIKAEVKLFFENDKRKKPKFVLTKNGSFISPKLDYTKMNHFLLGIGSSKKHNL